MIQVIEKILVGFTDGTAAAKFFGIFQGRCTLAAICFSTVGIYGWLHGHELASYTAFVTVMQGMLVLHSWKSDIHEQRIVAFENAKRVAGVTSDLNETDLGK